MSDQFNKFEVKFMGTSFEDSIIERFTDQFTRILDEKLNDHKQKFADETSMMKRDSESRFDLSN